MIRKTSLRSVWLAATAVVLGGTGISASAATLTLNLTADNEFSVYISTSPTLQGTPITLTGVGSPNIPLEAAPGPAQYYQANNWSADSSGTVNLTDNVTYYLNVVAKNNWNRGAPGPAGFLADLSLGAGNYKFANGGLSLTTDTSDWTVSTPIADASYANAGNQYGWSIAAPQTVSLASTLFPSVGTYNGGAPWGTITGISPNAEWIWSDSSYSGGDLTSFADASAPRYFQTEITYSAVPEAGTMLLGGCAIMPILTYRRRAKKA